MPTELIPEFMMNFFYAKNPKASLHSSFLSLYIKLGIFHFSLFV